MAALELLYSRLPWMELDCPLMPVTFVYTRLSATSDESAWMPTALGLSWPYTVLPVTREPWR